MTLLDGSKGGQTASQLDDLEALVQVADLHPAPATFERWLRAVLDRPTADAGVTLSTVHRVKGMEWDRVVVAGATEGILPHRLAEDEEEERRVLHVAITRGRHRVVVLADAARPSPFLDELDGGAPHGATKPIAPRSSAPARTKAKIALSETPAGAVPAQAALKAWRRERATADAVPAYVVATDVMLQDIAVSRPSTAAELIKISGMGPRRLELYGDDILAVLDTLD
jgi:DNA helicase-2/ATP-dependent DNA helicase PcrA